MAKQREHSCARVQYESLAGFITATIGTFLPPGYLVAEVTLVGSGMYMFADAGVRLFSRTQSGISERIYDGLTGLSKKEKSIS